MCEYVFAQEEEGKEENLHTNGGFDTHERRFDEETYVMIKY